MRRAIILFQALLLCLGGPSPASSQGTLSPDSLSKLTMAMFRAIEREREDEIRSLAAAGAPLDGDALIAALGKGPGMVRLIMGLGADINAPGSTFFPFMTPLVWAASSGDTAQIRLLLELGAEPNPPPAPKVIPPLLMAAMNNKVDAGRVLLRAGADPAVEGPSGASALDWATAAGLMGGDKEMAELFAQASPQGQEMLQKVEAGLNVDGTHQPGFQSLAPEQSTYSEGGFTGPCWARSTTDPPRPSPGDGGTGSYRETHVSFVGGMKVGMITPPDCTPLPLGPARYDVSILGVDLTWTWECDEGVRSETCLIVIKRETATPVTQAFEVGVEPAPEMEEETPEEECSVESVEIVSPPRGYQFSYDDLPAGSLKLRAVAEVQPAGCGGDPRWSIEDIGTVSARVEAGAAAGENAAILTYRGLPERNEDFGDKVITVEVGGKKDTLSVQVFFRADAFNHPGAEGTPNWFYYWRQTHAGTGEPMKHTPVILSGTVEGEEVQGQYNYTEDIVYLTDRLYRTSCAARTAGYGGGSSTGIDCFAEVTRHEGQHKKDRQEWWGAFDPMAAREKSLAAYLAEYDADGDLVPNTVERELDASRGCNWMWAWSCSGRPDDERKDMEMNSYAVGWSWIRGGADEEDWSWCGKQWIDARVCPLGRIW